MEFQCGTLFGPESYNLCSLTGLGPRTGNGHVEQVTVMPSEHVQSALCLHVQKTERALSGEELPGARGMASKEAA